MKVGVCRRCRWALPAVLFCSALFYTRPASAQAITGDILGTVRDSSGAVIPGAVVTLTQTGTGVQFRTTTGPDGTYSFSTLKPSHYSLTVSKKNFQSTTVSDIDLLLGQRPQVNIELKVGTTTEITTVNAGGVQLLDTQTSSSGQVIQQQSIVGLPLNGRDFMQLTVLTPGVSPIGSGNSPATSWTGLSSGSASTSVAGLRESNVSYLLDGIETRNARFGSENLHPSVDALEEFKMETNGFSAENGRSSAIVNMTLKSGSNAFHGNLYEFVRNSAFDANDYFYNAQGLPIPPYTQNDFGATLGGPIVRNKVFFFLSFEGFRSRLGQSGQALVPSPAQWAGNLSDNSAGTGVKTVVIDPYTGVPFTNNVIPSSMLDPTAQKWHQFTPTPNIASAAGSPAVPLFNYAASPKTRRDFNNTNGRIDYSIRTNDQLYGSYSIDDVPHVEPSVMPLAGRSWPLRSQVASLTENHLFSPQIVNEFRFGYNRSKTFLVSQGALGENYASTVFGLANTSDNPFDFGVPNAGIAGFTTIGSASESIGSIDQDFQWVDNLTIVKGRHTVTVGLDVTRERFYQITDFNGVPTFSFTGQFSGSSLADLLLGIPFTAGTSVGNSQQNLRSTFWAPYFQDDWRVAPTLTVNWGLRYEYARPPYDTHNRTAWFNPANGQVEYSDLGQVRNGVVQPDWNNFAPRLGFAYNPSFSKRTAIRGAFGMFYATDNWNELQFLVTAPRYYSNQSLTSDPTTPTLSLAHLFPAASLGGATSQPFSLDETNRTPYVLEWNFDIQQKLSSNWLLDVGYMGDKGLKLPQRRNYNSAAFDPTGKTPLATRTPYPNLSGILLSYNGGWSSYNALTVRAEKRTSNGFYFLGSYTYSKCLDVGNTDDTSDVGREFKLYDKGNCDYNTPQRAVFSYSYELPFGRGKAFLSGAGGIVNKLVSGWRATGITTFQAGQYMSVGLPTNWMNIGPFTANRPDKIGPTYAPNRNPSAWLNINSFTYPGCPSYLPCPQGIHVEGNSGRNQIEVPGINNWDIGVIKETSIGERVRTEFRVELFNTWNHTQFGRPSSSLVAGQFGRISSLLISPRQLQLGLKLFF